MGGGKCEGSKHRQLNTREERKMVTTKAVGNQMIVTKLHCNVFLKVLISWNSTRQI